MANVTIYAYFIYGIIDVPDISFLKMMVSERCLAFQPIFEHFDIYVNGYEVFGHNTPLFEGDVVRIVQKEH